jgi:hypothetical protein
MSGIHLALLGMNFGAVRVIPVPIGAALRKAGFLLVRFQRIRQ